MVALLGGAAGGSCLAVGRPTGDATRACVRWARLYNTGRPRGSPAVVFAPGSGAGFGRSDCELVLSGGVCAEVLIRAGSRVGGTQGLIECGWWATIGAGPWTV